MSPQSHQTLPRSMWVMLALLTLGWGMNWPMMKMALAEIPVWTFRALCTGAGALGLFIIARIGGQPARVPRGQWTRLTAVALLNVTIWNVLVAYGLQLLPAGRSVILAYSMPLWVVLLSALVLHEKLTGRRVLGVALGMAGMALLIGGGFVAMQSSPAGIAFTIGAAVSWALGTVLMRRYPTQLGTTAFTAWQLLVGGIPIMVGALILDWGTWQPIGVRAAIGLGYNVFLSTLR